MSSEAKYRWTLRASGTLAVLIGALVLYGWFSDSTFLKSIRPGWITMKFNAALGFVLSGISLLLLPFDTEDYPPRSARILSLRVVLIALALLGGLTLSEYALDRDFGIDELFMADDRPTGGGYIAGRMALQTASNFLLLACASLALLSTLRKKTEISQLGVVAMLFLSLTSLAGYAYGVASLGGMQSRTTMAFHTAALFLLLALGILCARPRSELMRLFRSTQAGGVSVRRLGAAAFFVPFFLGWIGAVRDSFPGLSALPFTHLEWILLLAALNSTVFLFLVVQVSRKLHRMEESKLRAEESLRLISRASQILGESLDAEAVLERLADTMAVAKSRWSVLFLESEEGELRLKVAASASEKLRSLSDILARFPFQRNPRSLMLRVFNTGQPLLVSEITEATLRSIAMNEEHFQALRGLGMGSIALAPILLMPAKKVLGVATIITERGVDPLTEIDLALVEEIGRRVGMAIENIRLYRKALSAVKIREEVLGVVAHDLKNPVSSISMSGELILRMLDSGGELKDARQKIRASADRIVSSSKSMERMIVDLLDLTRIEAGSLQLEYRFLDSDRLFLEAMEPFRPMAQAQGLLLKVDERSERIRLECDPDRLIQALSNLISNAIKFTPAGGSIVLKSEIQGEQALLSVSDTGKGIAPADLPRIFDRYWQAQRTAGQSLGLGLSIVKGVVQAHGGKAWATSQFGHGTTLFLLLPTRRQASVPSAA